MITGISEQTSKGTEEHFDAQFSQRRLWTAVLLQAIEDWRSNNIRRQREAERFFFSCEKDFSTVCRSAGFEPSAVLAKLQKMKLVTPRSCGARAWSQDLNAPFRAAA
jgi:hypothetical protein